MKYTLLGKDEGSAICQFCHKKEISILFIVQDNESGEILHFGSTCIHKALKIADDEWKLMKAELALKELKNPYNAHTTDIRNYHGSAATQASLTIGGIRYTRVFSGKRKPLDIFTKGQWIQDGYCRFLHADALKPIRKYFQDKERIEKKIKELTKE